MQPHFLRYVNCAAIGARREIGSVRHALMMLGLDPLREWLLREWPLSAELPALSACRGQGPLCADSTAAPATATPVITP